MQYRNPFNIKMKDKNYWNKLCQFKKQSHNIQKKMGVPINKYRTTALVAVMLNPPKRNCN